jgi:hypothetical protein
MDEIERAREFFRLLEGKNSEAVEIARRAFVLQEMLAKR